MEVECWLCDGRIKDREGANVPSLGITVHRRCLEADLGGGAPDAPVERRELD
jgi:hypothetical protein